MGLISMALLHYYTGEESEGESPKYRYNVKVLLLI